MCRANIDEVQLEWNEEASHLLSYSNQVIYLPRLNKRQLHRANTPASSDEEYLKKSNIYSIIGSFYNGYERKNQ